jgi:hypothetical protein
VWSQVYFLCIYFRRRPKIIYHPPLHLSSPLFLFLLRTLGKVPPEKDDGDEKDDYDDIFDVIGLEEVYIPVEITHHYTSF